MVQWRILTQPSMLRYVRAYKYICRCFVSGCNVQLPPSLPPSHPSLPPSHPSLPPSHLSLPPSLYFSPQLMRAEAQQAITSQMGETVTVLLQELEEERAEGIRKDSETGKQIC